MASTSPVWTIYQVKQNVDSNYAGMQGVFVKYNQERRIVTLRFIDGQEIPYGQHEVRKVGELAVQTPAQELQGPRFSDVLALIKETGTAAWNLSDALVLKVTLTQWTAAVKRAKVTVMDYEGFEGSDTVALDGTQADLEDAIENARTELEVTRAAVKRARWHAR